jgi:hypothetical protein
MLQFIRLAFASFEQSKKIGLSLTHSSHEKLMKAGRRKFLQLLVKSRRPPVIRRKKMSKKSSNVSILEHFTPL